MSERRFLAFPGDSLLRGVMEDRLVSSAVLLKLIDVISYDFFVECLASPVRNISWTRPHFYHPHLLSGILGKQQSECYV